MIDPLDPTDFLESFGRVLKSPDKSTLANFYDENAQVSVNTRILGHTGITNFLRLQTCEFTPESYTHMPLPDGAVLVSGTCIWGNYHSCFTFVLRTNPDDTAPPAKILHQFIMRIPFAPLSK
jgi:hypothetical protein